MKKIPFNKPIVLGDEFKNILTLKKKYFFSSNGFFTKKIQNWLIQNIDCKDAILTKSCTAALEICALLLRLKKKDEIIFPSYAFVSTANAFAMRGATPVFVDIDEVSLNIDVNKIEKAITKNTKAIVIVHYAGVACDMKKILKIKKKYGLYLIEDAAHAFLSKYKNKYLGSFGDLATFSFHETKNIHCGEGGALLINNKKFIKRSKVIRDKGTNREEFNNNIVKKYTWVDFGSSYALNEINAAFLYAQIKKAKYITKKRINIFNYYKHKFDYLNNSKSFFARLPKIPPYAKYNGHFFYLIVNPRMRDEIINFYKIKKIQTLFHYIPLHSSPFGKKISKKSGDLNVTDLISNSIIRFPTYLGISKNIIDLVSIEFKKYLRKLKIQV